jgi:hypothetical protein
MRKTNHLVRFGLENWHAERDAARPVFFKFAVMNMARFGLENLSAEREGDAAIPVF